jgi:dihydrolipoamide dehydrogenase
MVMGELEQSSEVLVIGAGPGGYAAAFRAADLGLEVTMVDPAPRPGGRCLHSACIPTKSLLFISQVIRDAERIRSMGIAFEHPRIDLDAMRRWRAGLIADLAENLIQLSRRRDIQLITARAEFENSRSVRLNGGEIRRIRFGHAVIATGARAVPFPGMTFRPGSRIMNAAETLKLSEIPQTLLVIGGGYVGLELGTIYATLGSRVSLVEAGERLLPGVDRDLVAPLQKRLETMFESIRLRTRVDALLETDRGVTARLENGNPAEKDFDRVLVAVGNRPVTEGLGLEHTGVEIDEKGFIKVDPQQRTDDDAILAVGDVAGGPMLAHKAAREGKVAAETIAGKASAFDARAIPAVVYTDPQIAWCGMTEDAALRQNRRAVVHRFPWRFSNRAAILGASEGLTKIIVDADNGRLLGAGIVGRQAEALIAEAVLAIEMGALAEDVALTIHPIPSLSETALEAAELYLGNALHQVKPESS